ncbi:MAG: hypothetical protein QM441_09945 [Synergistota bacterium]|jgi:hypothetical protein|nr:hypothetical protein [Synergistota bacterium]
MYEQATQIGPTREARAVPTKLDVDKLMERFGVPKGDVFIAWDELAEATGLERGTYRFQTVVSAWRRVLEQEYDTVLFAVPGQGLQVADSNTRIDLAARKVQLGERQKARWVEIAFKTDTKRLDSARRDTQARLMAAHGAFLKLHMATAPKPLPIP